MNIYDSNVYKEAYLIVSGCSSRMDRIREGVTDNVGKCGKETQSLWSLE